MELLMQANAAEKQSLAYARKGLLLAVVSGMIFGVDGLLVGGSSGFAPFDDPALLLLIPLFSGGIHDFCSACLVTLLNWRTGRMGELGRAFRSKPGRSVIAGSLLGAAFGLGGYMAALRLASPAYVLPITTTYPAVAAVMAVFVLKERIPPRAWAGLALCVAGAAAVGYVPPEGQQGELFYLGLAFAALAALGWGAQGVCSTSGMDFIEPEVALNMYYIISSVLYLLFLVPLACLVFGGEDGWAALSWRFLTSRGTAFVALAGFVGSTSYICWYRAMNRVGVSRAMALNISYALWGILFSFLFTDARITSALVAGALVIFAGMFLVIGNPREMLKLRAVE
jgi:drug/metabolite transporter (DMT)-like permease